MTERERGDLTPEERHNLIERALKSLRDLERPAEEEDDDDV